MNKKVLNAFKGSGTDKPDLSSPSQRASKMGNAGSRIRTTLVTEVTNANSRSTTLQNLVPKSVEENRGPEVRTDATHLAEKGGDPRVPEKVRTARDLEKDGILPKDPAKDRETDLEARLQGVTLLLDHPNEEKDQGKVLASQGKAPETDLDPTRQGGVATDPTSQMDQLAKKPQGQWERRLLERQADLSAKTTK